VSVLVVGAETVETGLEVATVEVGLEGELKTEDTGLEPVGLDALESIPEFLEGGVPRPTAAVAPLSATPLPAEMDLDIAGDAKAPAPDDVERTMAGEDTAAAGAGRRGGRD
jgi:hypothetical protein